MHQQPASWPLSLCRNDEAVHIVSSQVFRQQAESVKIAQQQQRHAAKVKAKEAVIDTQLQAEEQAHQRAVAARKVQHSAVCFDWTA
jgi:hypothetical protein